MKTQIQRNIRDLTLNELITIMDEERCYISGRGDGSIELKEITFIPTQQNGGKPNGKHR